MFLLSSVCWEILEMRWTKPRLAWTLSWRNWRRCPTWPAVSKSLVSRCLMKFLKRFTLDLCFCLLVFFYFIYFFCLMKSTSFLPCLRSQAVVCHRRAGRHPDRHPHSLLRPLMSVTARCLHDTHPRLHLHSRTDAGGPPSLSPSLLLF